jgi:hypothetical protein
MEETMASFQLNDPMISITEETLLQAVANARTAMAWDKESKDYYQGQIDAYTSLLKGLL